MRVLVITKIFPNAKEPLSAPFNRRQFAALARRCSVEVLATIPWFPGAGLLRNKSSAGRLVDVPRHEMIDDLPVGHPRTLFLPRMAHGLWAPLYAASLAPLIPHYRRQDIDVVLGSWAYPDGVAALAFAKALGVPAVIKLHGSDINGLAELPGPRRMLRLALPRATRIVAVSKALAAKAVELGASPRQIEIVANGVDNELFRPQPRDVARQRLGMPAAWQAAPHAPLALYVGNLKEGKGIFDLVTAFADVRAQLPTARLVIVGDGEAKQGMLDRLEPLGDAVLWVGALPADQVAQWMAACDVLVLPSWAEGTPNVVLEALASGRRVVATKVGGTPDLLTRDELGELVPAKAPRELGQALVRALQTDYDPAVVARLGARGGWQRSADHLYEVLLAAHRESRSHA